MDLQLLSSVFEHLTKCSHLLSQKSNFKEYRYPHFRTTMFVQCHEEGMFFLFFFFENSYQMNFLLTGKRYDQILFKASMYKRQKVRVTTFFLIITKTCLYNVDPFKPHLYIVKLGFIGVYIIFLIFAQNMDCGYSLEPPRRGGSNEYLQSMFLTKI